jgi:hypothetical protein
MEVLEVALKLKAAVPPKLTAEGQVRFVPVMVRIVPLVPVLELTELIVGEEVFTVKFVEDVAIPPLV